MKSLRSAFVAVILFASPALAATTVTFPEEQWTYSASNERWYSPDFNTRFIEVRDMMRSEGFDAPVPNTSYTLTDRFEHYDDIELYEDRFTVNLLWFLLPETQYHGPLWQDLLDNFALMRSFDMRLLRIEGDNEIEILSAGKAAVSFDEYIGSDVIHADVIWSLDQDYRSQITQGDILRWEWTMEIPAPGTATLASIALLITLRRHR